MRPLILITNDDGITSRGLRHLAKVAAEFGDVVVMAPDHNASGLSTSITCNRPLRVSQVEARDGVAYYSCDGTPADCVKMGLEYFCPRPPALVLSGINFGTNASINIVYSGTMGAVLEANLNGIPAVGFSLLNHSPEADFVACSESVRRILQGVLEHPLPLGTSLNVNIPRLPANQIKGIRICRQAQAAWKDSLERRVDPIGRPYWWMTGRFECDDRVDGSDEFALAEGYVSVVPVHTDFTDYAAMNQLKYLET